MWLASGLHSSKSASNNRVRGQVESGAALELETGAVREQGGTVNLSAVDATGNMAALTITHGTPPRYRDSAGPGLHSHRQILGCILLTISLSTGGAFGACVGVEKFGLILGHGMSRFEVEPGKQAWTVQV